LLDRLGNGDIQLDMLYDYQPPMLIVWGKNDFIFPPEGATPYNRELPNVETHLLGTGHFALETHGEEIASRIEHFFGRNG
jgi:pimeloyl-ACP methyl ester carboxylesterase